MGRSSLRARLCAGVALSSLMMLGANGSANAEASDAQIKAMQAQVEQLTKTVNQLMAAQKENAAEAKAAKKQASQADANAAQAKASVAEAKRDAGQDGMGRARRLRPHLPRTQTRQVADVLHARRRDYRLWPTRRFARRGDQEYRRGF